MAHTDTQWESIRSISHGKQSVIILARMLNGKRYTVGKPPSASRLT